MDEAVGYATARARLVVSYGMTEYGAQKMLTKAETDGSAEDYGIRVTCIDRYPPRFTVCADL